MGKLSDLAKTPPKREYNCMLTAWSMNLDDEDRKALWEMIDNPDWPTRTLWGVLRDAGFPGSNSVIGKHRSKECVSCYSR